MANRTKPENEKSSVSMQVRCTPKFKERVDALIASGAFPSISEAVRVALTPYIEQHEAKQ